MTRVGFFVAVAAFLASVFPASAELLPPDRSMEEVIDHYINVKLSEAKITPARTCDDTNLLRRTMLDLVGRIPTVREAQEYSKSNNAEKRQQLVDRLVNSAAFARHQSNEFDTMLMYGTGRNMRSYLLAAFQENRTWDAIFRDTLLADEKDEKKKVAAEFIKSRVRDLDKLTNAASVAFFGINVSCAKCHDHPLVPEWTQNHFFGMKSFFNRTFDNGGFLGERDYGIVKYKTTKGEERVAQLMFLSGKSVF